MPEDLSDDQWQQAFDLTREKNRQQHRQFITLIITESLLSFTALGLAFALVVTGRWIGILFALAATSVPKIRRVAEIARSWAGLPKPDDDDIPDP